MLFYDFCFHFYGKCVKAAVCIAFLILRINFLMSVCDGLASLLFLCLIYGLSYTIPGHSCTNKGSSLLAYREQSGGETLTSFYVGTVWI